MRSDVIIIQGAKENNLKNINVEIPKYKLVALTGVSGSGKSSFAIDILQKECQRQYLESMGMVTDGLNKANVDKIIGLSPSILVGQRLLSNNIRSTVGTYTEISTYLRILYAKLATRICFNCHNEIKPQYIDLDDESSVKCPHCQTELEKLKMGHFSFNKTMGACIKCHGVGEIKDIDLSQIVDENLTIRQGAVKLWGNEVFSEHYANVYEKCGEHYGFKFDVNKPVKEFDELERLVFLYGIDDERFKARFKDIKKPKRVMDGNVEGLYTFLNKKVIESTTKKVNSPIISNAIISKECDECHGTRLGFDGRHAILNGKTIVQVNEYTMDKLVEFVNEVNEGLDDNGKIIAQTIINDILKKCNGLIKIGLDYLSLNRPIGTLSGGENQRIRLTSVLESALTGVLYILDEPTTGLHAKDTTLLLNAIRRLVDLGNTVLVIEHDMDFVKQCDHVIDFGIDAGVHGGEIVAYGDIETVSKNTDSKTAKYLRKEKLIVNDNELKLDKYLEVVKANIHNLKDVSVKIPLNKLVSFAGVSGSGKSSLVFDCIEENKNMEALIGLETINKIIKIDQTPIGRQNRSNIATYTEVFTLIRELYANQKQAKQLKLKTSDFSFNVKGGRCDKCEGLGKIFLDMQFLDDVEVLCPVCKGKRFNNNILTVNYQEKNISEILNMTVLETLNFFKDNKEILKILKTLDDVGLGYLTLGQATSTLSGGECQRLKLSRELAKGNGNNTLYLLDEPTTGLHPSDSEKLLILLKKLVAQNNSVFVIEHSLEILSQSDYIIELGPYGGDKGGEIIAEGTPKELSINPNSITGKFL